MTFISREDAVALLSAALDENALPAAVLYDWRIHPLTLARLIETVRRPGALILDVGAGRSLTLSTVLAGRGRVVAVDRKPMEADLAGVLRVVADAAVLPFGDGEIPLVVSRLFFGAPISQAARRAVALGKSPSHVETAAAHERAIWHELFRITSPGGWHVHHVLERVLYARPQDAGFMVHWALRDDVDPPKPPYRASPLAALRYHLSGVVVLQRPAIEGPQRLGDRVRAR